MAEVNKAAENSELFVELGIAARDAGDYAKAIEWFGKAVEQGSAPAQFHLGILYSNGRGVSQDYAKAAEWCQKAAEQGHAGAQSGLGFQYALGRGVSQDYAKAAEWFGKAAAQGDVFAQCSLGLCYKDGKGVPQDKAKAAEWYGKAAEQGYADAQYELGMLYVKGQGVPQDSVKADELLRKAAAQGHAEAKDFLAKAAKEKHRKIGRVIALILVVFSIIMRLTGSAGKPVTPAIAQSFFFLIIPFLFLYFSSRKIFKWIFLCVGVFLSLVISTLGDMGNPAIIMCMFISYLASCIMVMIFP